MLLLMMNDYKTVWNLNEQGADISAYFRGSFLKKKIWHRLAFLKAEC